MKLSFDPGTLEGSPPVSSTDREGSNLLSAADVQVFRSSILGFQPDMPGLTPQLAEALKVGARVVAAKQFWKVARVLGNSVVDTTAGVGSEMAVARKYMWKVAAWDPDENKRAISRSVDFLQSC